MKQAIAALIVPALVLALAALSVPRAAAEEETIYKWLDGEGVVHYSAQPPEGVEYEEVSIAARESARDNNDAQTEAAAGEGDDRVPEQPEMTTGEPDPEVVAERCEQARSNIERLRQHANLVVRGDDGEQRSVDEEERQSMIEETQAFIEEWC